MQFDAKGRAGYRYCVFGRFFAEVFERHDCAGDGLDFVENEQRFVRFDSFAAFCLEDRDKPFGA